MVLIHPFIPYLISFSLQIDAIAQENDSNNMALPLLDVSRGDGHVGYNKTHKADVFFIEL